MSSHWTASSIPDQRGRRVIITGANSGIGYETALALASCGAKVILACRSRSKAEEAQSRIFAAVPGASVEFRPLDLMSLASIRAFAEGFRTDCTRLDLLCNNAGIMMVPRQRTEDGFEAQIGTNHLGHFALTGLLLDRLLATEGSRVVNVSSLAHRRARIKFDDLNSRRSYSPMGAYGQSKLANLLFTVELERRLRATAATTLAAASHPGWTATNLQSNVRLFAALNPFFGQRCPMGALPTLYAATSPHVAGAGYYGPGGFGELRGLPKRVRMTRAAHDPGAAAQLWDVSEQLTGVRFDLPAPRPEP